MSGSDRFTFASPLKIWTPVAVSPMRQVIVTDGGVGRPSKIRFDLWDCGPAFYFENGIELHIKSSGSPFLSWKEGSVKNGIPTPASEWVALSFQDRQPPIVFGFPEANIGLQIDGEIGNWVITSSKSFKGWVRIGLPYGIEPYRSSTAEGLGKLSQRCKEQENLWYAPIADVPEPEIEQDSDGVVATWRLPRKRCLVPNMFYFNQFGDYPLRIQSPISEFPSASNEGPMFFTSEPVFTARFPVRRIPSGRGLTVGEPFSRTYSSSDWTDPIKLVDIALSNTLLGRSQQTSSLTNKIAGTYFEQFAPQTEPISRLSTFYDQTGKGALEVAVHSLLSQSIRTGEADMIGVDPQFLSLFWRLDPYTGSMGLEPPVHRRVAAIAAIAGSFSSDPKMRLYAAMLQCSLSTERSKNAWRRRNGETGAVFRQSEPLLNIRKGLFSLKHEGPQSAVVSNWLSEVRCYGPTPLWVQKQDVGYDLCWNPLDKAIRSLSFESAFPIKFTSKVNLKSLFPSQRLGYSEIRYEPLSTDQCTALLEVPDWATPLPLTALPPEYSEPTL